MQVRSECKSCGILSGEPKVGIKAEDWDLLLTLAKEMTTEWLVTCNYNEATKAIELGEHLRIPKQEVSGAYCEAKEDLGGNCFIHSHVDMSTFHSGVDVENRNGYIVSLVINKKGENYVTIKRTTECGRYTVTVGKLVILYPVYNKDYKKEIVDKLKENATPKTYAGYEGWRYNRRDDDDDKKWENWASKTREEKDELLRIAGAGVRKLAECDKPSRIWSHDGTGKCNWCDEVRAISNYHGSKICIECWSGDSPDCKKYNKGNGKKKGGVISTKSLATIGE
jgi:hypothetical protein